MIPLKSYKPDNIFRSTLLPITPEKFSASVRGQEESERATEKTRLSRDRRVLLCDRDWAAARMPNLPAPPKIFPCNLASLTSIKRPNLGPPGRKIGGGRSVVLFERRVASRRLNSDRRQDIYSFISKIPEEPIYMYI